MREGSCWVFAAVVDHLGTVSYFIRLPNGDLWRKHIYHLRQNVSIALPKGNTSDVQPTDPSDDFLQYLLSLLLMHHQNQTQHYQISLILEIQVIVQPRILGQSLVHIRSNISVQGNHRTIYMEPFLDLMNLHIKEGGDVMSTLHSLLFHYHACNHAIIHYCIMVCVLCNYCECVYKCVLIWMDCKPVPGSGHDIVSVFFFRLFFS